jgi:hypothetical protein
MTQRQDGVDAGPDREEPAPAADAAHLDQDPEAVEDPVHAGDARHQREARDAAPDEA